MRNLDHNLKRQFGNLGVIVLARRTLYLFIAIVLGSSVGLNAQSAPLFKVLCLGLPDVNHPQTGAAGNKAVQEIAAGQNYTVDICTDYTQINDAFLAPYQVMIWVMAAPLDWPRPIQASIEKFVQSGKGWIGFHVSGLTGISNPEWQWYMDWLGGLTFKGHPGTRQNGSVVLEPTQKDHPLLQGLPSPFTVHEEWYSWTSSPRGKTNITILATVDESSYDPQGTAMGKDHPIMWSSNKYGPMVYTSLGHEPEQFSNVNVRKFIANAIPWAAKSSTEAVSPSIRLEKHRETPVLRWDGHGLKLENAAAGNSALDPLGRLIEKYSH